MNELMVWVSYHRQEQLNEYNLRENGTLHLYYTNELDVSGENINYLNPFYSEIVTLYWVWKNEVRSKKVGFCHYRRLFGKIIDFGLHECQVLDINNNCPVYKHYKLSHNYQDLSDIIDIIDDMYGKGNKYSDYILHSNVFVPFCSFVMCWSDFTGLCEFLFPILDAYDKKHKLNMRAERYMEKAKNDFRYDDVSYQQRAVSFLAERIISCYIVCRLKPYCVETL